MPFDKRPGNPNVYLMGIGIANAATIASNCKKSFPSIKLALIVGIYSVIPFKPNKDEIYDFRWQLPGHFARKDTLLDLLGRPNQEIQGVLAKLQSCRNHQKLSAKIAEYLNILRQELELSAEYPGIKKDILFDAFYRHTVDQKSCKQLKCNGKLVLRHRLKTAKIYPAPAIHFSLMASGNSVIKSGEDCNRIAVQKGVIKFKMEGARVWDSFPCIIIKGACNYTDSHKDKGWQRYTAATAAAYVKAFLGFWVPSLNQAGATLRVLSIKAKKDYSVFWVPALSRASFEQACMQIIDACDFPTTDNSDAIETFCLHLSSKRAGKWLLVIDNADNT
ncbi:uncharacterized protein FFUJ_12417 [Fusarium fujikuroi IMI 58289]|uniref:PNPLA domain-containing protein n=1 Tax=Gibberella fujikuroi (strain CBS 195.34 / IMI 58289 / NRRL A-6831) TaxID=1279085 RepID=S0ECE3_GIBF5|nr:uncharacterized protein FFUJ_12417 [Fusarium fujikuroi IMI 58289]CCT72539.1 uncharacterized protein FFUJ_12417 [Fusarium fujikuroi IMI 58289]SCO23061.1 uncharacterized protein FFM5_13210 [Fusarium fujikuroi]